MKIKFITILITIIASISAAYADYSPRLQAKLAEHSSAGTVIKCEGAKIQDGGIICVPVTGHPDGGRAFKISIVPLDTDRATSYLSDIITGENLAMSHGLRFTTSADGSSMYAGMFTLSTTPAAEMFAGTVGGTTAPQKYAVFTWGDGAGFEKPGVTTDTMPVIGVSSVELVMSGKKAVSLMVKQTPSASFKVRWSQDMATWSEVKFSPATISTSNGEITRNLVFTGETAAALVGAPRAFFQIVP